MCISSALAIVQPKELIIYFICSNEKGIHFESVCFDIRDQPHEAQIVDFGLEVHPHFKD